MSKKIYKTNPRIVNLISDLNTASREGGVNIWNDVARRLRRPTRNYAEINLSKLNRHTSKDDVVIIPGKVLGSGTIEHKLTVAALGFSTAAKEKITNSGGSWLMIEDLIQKNPSGSGVRIMQ